MSKLEVAAYTDVLTKQETKGTINGAPSSKHSVCLVQRLNIKDDVDLMPTWNRRVNRMTPFSSMMAVVSYWIYFGFRIRYTIDAQQAAHQIFVYAWIFIAVEMGVACVFEASTMHSLC